MSDHVHLLIGLNPKVYISDTVKEVKRLSSIFINDLNIFKGRFQWQEGYGAFSYGRSQLDVIYKYIKDQEHHHLKRTFKDEYQLLLKKLELEFDKRYLFKYFE